MSTVWNVEGQSSETKSGFSVTILSLKRQIPRQRNTKMAGLTKLKKKHSSDFERRLQKREIKVKNNSHYLSISVKDFVQQASQAGML